MAYEVDFLAVGEGERSGDAIALRYLDSNGAQRIAVIDGGTKESGAQLVEHIKYYYGTDQVDYVFSTHPDQDHASGLTVVLENLSVGALIMHKPWDYADEVCNLVDKEVTALTMERKLIKSLRNARELEKIANRKNIPIHEPFQGLNTGDGFFHVLGPSRDYYHVQLSAITEDVKNPLGKLLGLGQKAVEEAVRFVKETWEQGTLAEPGEHEVSPNNNTSAIVLFNLDGKKFLFTGDAGSQALHLAADYANGMGVSLEDLTFLDVPHHGSKHNVGPSILNRIKATRAFISAAAQSPKHPSKKVTNELLRKGSTVVATQGEGKCHHDGFQTREGWSPSDTVPFYDDVED